MLTEQELIARRSRIGASDMAAILGMPTFAGVNAHKIWLDKTGQLEPEKSSAKHIRAGNRLEPVVLDYAEESLGKLSRNVVVFAPDGSPIASTCDAIVVANGHPVEAKTSGIEGPIHGYWGEAGTDEVPDGYLIQCQVQLLCTRAEACHLMALLGSRGFVEYAIYPEPRLHKLATDVASDFMDRYVTPRRDPRGDWGDRLRTVHGVDVAGDPCEPILEVVQRLRRHTGKVIAIDDPQDVIDWQHLRETRLAAEKAEAAALARCLATLGDAEIGELPGGMVLAYTQQNTADIIDRAAMKAAGIYETYATKNTCRVARVKRMK